MNNVNNTFDNKFSRIIKKWNVDKIFWIENFFLIKLEKGKLKENFIFLFSSLSLKHCMKNLVVCEVSGRRWREVDWARWNGIDSL